MKEHTNNNLRGEPRGFTINKNLRELALAGFEDGIPDHGALQRKIKRYGMPIYERLERIIRTEHEALSTLEEAIRERIKEIMCLEQPGSYRKASTLNKVVDDFNQRTERSANLKELIESLGTLEFMKETIRKEISDSNKEI